VPSQTEFSTNTGQQKQHNQQPESNRLLFTDKF